MARPAAAFQSLEHAPRSLTACKPTTAPPSWHLPGDQCLSRTASIAVGLQRQDAGGGLLAGSPSLSGASQRLLCLRGTACALFPHQCQCLILTPQRALGLCQLEAAGGAARFPAPALGAKQG